MELQAISESASEELYVLVIGFVFMIRNKHINKIYEISSNMIANEQTRLLTLGTRDNGYLR